MKNILLHAWVLHKLNNKFYLPYTHWVYLNEIQKKYSSVCLLSPVIKASTKDELADLLSIDTFKNVTVHELPGSKSYISAIKYFPHYVRAYKKLSAYDCSYVRYPVPFGWLQKVSMKGERIIHYVGDPVDTIKKNSNLSLIRKIFYVSLFTPEHLLYLWASKGNVRVVTNGLHLAKKLQRHGVTAKPMISSTLSTEDFHLDLCKEISATAPRITYVGYLRKAKGVDTVLRSFQEIQKDLPNATLSVVGSGEIENELRSTVKNHTIQNVTFHGHIDNRNELNKILRNSDIFCFASISEGSPRVILEAIANGLNVVSTPVGSLPYVFTDKKEILFANFNDPTDFSEKIKSLINNPKLSQKLRVAAYDKVKSMTIENFIEGVFHEA